MARALTLVSTPAGFGKTTLLAHWAEQAKWPVAWVSLDPDDNDPARFWRYVVAALRRASQGAPERRLPAFAGSRPGSNQGGLTVVGEELNASPDGIEQALVSIYHGQQEHAWTRGTVEYVEAALERAGLYRRLHRPPAMCFLDLTGYTRLTEERGDEAAAELAARLRTLVRRSSREHGGQPVKWLGDGVMFYFPDPGSAVLGALDMVEGVAAHALPPARVGIHAGPVIFQEGDYFGRTVNIASRIAEHAMPGQVLVSQEVVDAVDRKSVTFTEIGAVELRSVTGAVRLHSARRGP